MADKPPPILSLYDDLVSANPNATISAAPVLYKKEDEMKAKLQSIQQRLNAARPQPKRPQAPQAKGGLRPKILPSSSSKAPGTSSSGVRTSSPEKHNGSGGSTHDPGSSGPPRSGLDDWIGDGDEGDWYEGPKRERGGRKKRKKNNKEKEREKEELNWDLVYDPTRPTSYEAYKDSEERMQELEEWMALLRGGRRHRDSTMRSSRSRSEAESRKPMNKMFAPPAMNFAPPTNYDDEPSDASLAAPTAIPEVSYGDDAYARRMRMSGIEAPAAHSSTPLGALPSLYSTSPVPTSDLPPPPPPPAPPSYPPGVVLSAEPVRYALPPPPPDLPSNDEELAAALQASSQDLEREPSPEPEPERSNRPGQKGFAARYMAKHGYKKGEGLGASGTGILSALAVKVEKPKKIFDAEGNASKVGGSMGKIVGGKKKKGTEDGKMSSVVRCLHMVDGRDLDFDMGPDGNLVEEIGHGCADKYGNIERVLVHRGAKGESVPVFLKFTAQISALRAVAALDGQTFGGNVVKAEFWDEEKFDKGIYE